MRRDTPAHAADEFWPSRLTRGEDGMLSLASLFVVLGFLLLISLIGNVAHTVNQKVGLQGVADAEAYSAAVEMARGLNTVTATNHLIGELTALVVLHHALGGDELDGLRQADPAPADVQTALRTAYQTARAATTQGGPAPLAFQYDAVRQELRVGASIRDCRIRLKQVMTWAYTGHAVGGFFQQLGWIPYVGPALRAIGYSTILAAMAFESKVYAEWLVLDGLELTARLLAPVKQALQDVLIPGLHLYANAVVLETPPTAERLAGDIGRRGGADGILFPGLSRNASEPPLQLPVVEEPEQLDDLTRSQLVRATTPWVQHWRTPLLRFGEQALLLARFKHHYLSRSNEFTLTLSRRLKEEKGINLFILRDLDLDGADKGNEPWAWREGSRRADELFAVLAFAHRPPAKVFAPGIFGQPNRDGLAAYAQALIYNANPRPERPPGPGMQPAFGWDTLNWEKPVPEFSKGLPRAAVYTVVDVPEPRIRLNWQAKLTPTTRLAEAVEWQQGGLGRILQRTAAELPLAGSH